MSDNDQVDVQISEYLEMAARWELPNALLGGTHAMRKKGQKFLPKHTSETNEDYRGRLMRSVVFPGYSKTIDILVGKPFQSLLTVVNPNPLIEQWQDDIDLQGTDLHTFFKEVFKDAMNTGKSHVLVDYMATEGMMTLADEEAIGARPYLVHIESKQLIGWKSQKVNGVEKLTEVRYEYYAPMEVGNYNRVMSKHVRLLRPGYWEEHVQVEDGSWIVIDSGEMLGANGSPLAEIPLYTYYTNRKGFMTAFPPLEDLAYLNEQHWQSQSDQFNILTWARVPILFGKGWAQDEDQEPVDIGANKVIEGPEGSDLKYVEHSGQAIASGKAHAETLEDQMRVIGVEVLVNNRPGNVTATERAIQTAETNSTLKTMTLVFEQFITKVLGKLGLYDSRITSDNVGRADLNTDFGFSLSTATDMTTLLEMHRLGQITAKTVVQEAQRRHILSDDIKPSDEVTEAQNQVKTQTTQDLVLTETETEARVNNQV